MCVCVYVCVCQSILQRPKYVEDLQFCIDGFFRSCVSRQHFEKKDDQGQQQSADGSDPQAAAPAEKHHGFFGL